MPEEQQVVYGAGYAIIRPSPAARLSQHGYFRDKAPFLRNCFAAVGAAALPMPVDLQLATLRNLSLSWALSDARFSAFGKHDSSTHCPATRLANFSYPDPIKSIRPSQILFGTFAIFSNQNRVTKILSYIER